MEIPTRHKDERPNAFPLTVEREGQQDKVNIPIQKLPAWLWLQRFTLPACIDKRYYDKSIETINVRGGSWVLLGRHLVKELGDELNADSLAVTVTYTGHNFARLLAKIAYGFAIEEFGANIIDDAYVLPALLGDSKNIGQWVGCAGKPPDGENNLHEIRLSVKNGDIYAYVRLFAKFAVAPEYLVVVGHAPFVQEDSLRLPKN